MPQEIKQVGHYLKDHGKSNSIDMKCAHAIGPYS